MTEGNGPIHVCTIKGPAETRFPFPCTCGELRIVYREATRTWDCYRCGNERGRGQLVMVREIKAREKGDSAR